MTLANKIIQVSVCFYGTSPTYCTVCLPPKVKYSYVVYLTLFTLHSPPSTPFLLVITGLFFCVWEFLFFLVLCYCWFYIPHMNEITWFLTFSVWLISHSLVFSRPIHIVTNGHISSFHLLYYKFPSEDRWSVCSKPHPISWWFAGNIWTSKACTCITQSLPPSHIVTECSQEQRSK